MTGKLGGTLSACLIPARANVVAPDALTVEHLRTRIEWNVNQQAGLMQTNHAVRLLHETDDFADAQHVVDVPGMSSPRVCQFLNRLVSALDPGEHYLEIGSWYGRTLLSAAAHNEGRLCIACDKFRAFGRYTGLGYRARRALHRNVARYPNGRAVIHVYDMPSRRFLARRRYQGSVGVFFYDGDHSYRGTRQSIAAGARWLSSRAVVLVDDWNVSRIRRATFDGFEDADVRIEWHRGLHGDHSENTWWNGLGVFYIAGRSTYVGVLNTGCA